MTGAICLVMTALGTPPGPATADNPPDRSANAALKYWQAFATLPRLTPAEQARITADGQTMPLDAPAREAVTRAGYALRMMRRGAAVPGCDWGVGWADEGFENR